MRRALLARVPQGEGPTSAQMDAGWFALRSSARAAAGASSARSRGGDPGYRETSRMLADATLCLALDDLPATAGQVTTAQAMGPALRARLQAPGIGFAVVD